MKLTRKQLEADFECCFERAQWAGHCTFAEDRFVGRSSNAIFRFAYGGKPPDKSEMPADNYDLEACKRTVAKLPAHRATAEVYQALDRAIKAVAT